MENKTIKTRESSFELLRIFAMFMIVAHHLSVHGVQQVSFDSRYLSYTNGSFFNQLFTCFLIPGGKVGVALFFMITGFFMCRKENSSVNAKSIMGVITMAAAYNTTITLKAEGADEKEAAEAILALFESKFEED